MTWKTKRVRTGLWHESENHVMHESKRNGLQLIRKPEVVVANITASGLTYFAPEATQSEVELITNWGK